MKCSLNIKSFECGWIVCSRLRQSHEGTLPGKNNHIRILRSCWKQLLTRGWLNLLRKWQLESFWNFWIYNLFQSLKYFSKALQKQRIYPSSTAVVWHHWVFFFTISIDKIQFERLADYSNRLYSLRRASMFLRGLERISWNWELFSILSIHQSPWARSVKNIWDKVWKEYLRVSQSVRRSSHWVVLRQTRTPLDTNLTTWTENNQVFFWHIVLSSSSWQPKTLKMASCPLWFWIDGLFFYFIFQIVNENICDLN